MQEQSESVESKSSPCEDQSPGLLPRVSISNIKSPSKRHQTNSAGKVLTVAASAEVGNCAPQLDWLFEVKQFVSFFNIHFYVSIIKRAKWHESNLYNVDD